MSTNDLSAWRVQQHEAVEDLLGRVRREPPAWAGEIIEAWDEEGFRRIEPFTSARYWCENASLNVFQIVGTRHPDYQGRSWRWLLENGKRMHLNLPLHATNPGYYLDQAHKMPTMSFLSLDGQRWFVDDDGNHRSCIARFDFHYRGRAMLHGLEVEDRRIDHDLVRLHEALCDRIRERRLAWRVEPVNRTVRREDGPGWMRETYAPGLQVTREDGTQRCYDSDGARDLLEEIERPRWRRWFTAWGAR